MDIAEGRITEASAYYLREETKGTTDPMHSVFYDQSNQEINDIIGLEKDVVLDMKAANVESLPKLLTTK